MQSECRCFVCDCKLEKDKSKFSRIDVAQTISNLLGGEYVIVINEEDQLCKLCNSLVSRVGRLEKMLSEANTNLLTLLHAKHSASPQRSKRPDGGSKEVEKESEYGACFVCDSSLDRSDIKAYKRSDVARLIANLLGGEYVILIGEQDYLCQVCLSLAHRIRRVKLELHPSKISLHSLLRAKYFISPSQSQDEIQEVKPSAAPNTGRTVSVTDQTGVQICELPFVGSAVEFVKDARNSPHQIQTVTSLADCDSWWDETGNTTTTRSEEIEEISSDESSPSTSLTTNNDQRRNTSLPRNTFMNKNSEPRIVEVGLNSRQSTEMLTSYESIFVSPTPSYDQFDEQSEEMLPYSDNIATQTVNAIPKNRSSVNAVVNTVGNNGRKRQHYEISHLGFDFEGHTKKCNNKSVSTDDLPGSLSFKGKKISLKTIGCQVSNPDFNELNSKKYSSEDCEVVVEPEPDVNKQKKPKTNGTQVSININIGSEKTVDVDCTVKNSNKNLKLHKNVAVNKVRGLNCISEKNNGVICVGSKKINLKYSCAGCKFKSSTYDELKMHIRNPGNGSFCNICEVGFHRKPNLKTHLQQHSHMSELRECRHCGASLHDKTHYNSHFRWSHKAPEKQLPFCADCNIGYTYKRSLRHHLIMKHGRDFTYPCKQCKKVFLDPVKLNKHVSCYHRESRNCKFCGKREENIEKLFVHEKTHRYLIGETDGEATDNVKPKEEPALYWQLLCRFCRKKFRTKLEVVAHSAQCRMRYRFICEDCGKTFTNNYALQQHRGSNCGTCSQYQCEQCGELFKMVTQLRHHVTTKHLGPLPHACLTCHKRFGSHNGLLRHQRHNHAASYYTFSCRGCDRSFSKAHVYISHAIREHQDYSVLEEVGSTDFNASEVPSV